jgi:hypothetical protein
VNERVYSFSILHTRPATLNDLIGVRFSPISLPPMLLPEAVNLVQVTADAGSDQLSDLEEATGPPEAWNETAIKLAKDDLVVQVRGTAERVHEWTPLPVFVDV